MKAYRVGGLGAMMDEYERAANELLALLATIAPERFEMIIDSNAPEHARSIQAIMRHVVGAGYNYANYIRKTWGFPVANPPVESENRDTTIASMHKMLAYTEETLDGKWALSDDDIDRTSMMSRWGVPYSLEQMLEHAIVHILRHRRQIERILS